MIFAWIRFVIAALFILGGLVSVVLAVLGVYRFNYVINRMHIAALGDTLGVILIAAGIIILNGLNPMDLKLLMVVAFFWLSNPVGGHLITQTEVETNETFEEECEVMNHEHI